MLRALTFTVFTVHLLALLAPGSVLAGSGGSSPPSNQTPPPPLAIPDTYVFGSHDLGDLGWDWSKNLTLIDQDPEQLGFKWATDEPGAARGRWTVYDENGTALQTGELASAPTPGNWKIFFVYFANPVLGDVYRVRVQALNANGAALGLVSSAVKVTIGEPGEPTVFTDKGLGIPIDEKLEAIRAKWNVPALGGAVVTPEGFSPGALGVVGIRRDGDPTPAELEDAWHLGSDTKAMTATLAGILAQRGEIAWTLSVGEAFPEWAAQMDPEWADMDLEELFSHRSGFLVIYSEEGDVLWDANLSLTERRREFTRRIVQRAPLGITGLTYHYNNGNFVIAGAMLEAITGKSWEVLMQDELFDPLGMTTAGFGNTGFGDPARGLYGHTDESGNRVSAPGESNSPALGPAGTVHASLRDWARFIRLHLTGEEGAVELYPWTLSKLHTAWPTNPLWPTSYGWGWGVGDEFGFSLGHSGSNGLWYCSVSVYPEMDFALLATTNIGSDMNGDGDMAVSETIQMLKAREMEWDTSDSGEPTRGSIGVGSSGGTGIGSASLPDSNSDGVSDFFQCADGNGSGSYESDDLYVAYDCLIEDSEATGRCAEIVTKADTNGNGQFDSDDLRNTYRALLSQGSAAETGTSLTCPAQVGF